MTLAETLELLHRHGYRLREFTAGNELVGDSIKVSDGGEAARAPAFDLARERDIAAEAKRLVWSHVGGEPPGLRKVPEVTNPSQAESDENE